MEVSLRSTYRTHTCGELRLEHEDESIILSGWIARKRDHGGVIFVDLRDNYGITQVVFDSALRDGIQDIRVESTIRIVGTVRKRASELINPKLATGAIEVAAQELLVLGEAEVLPFQIADDDNAPEATRLQYRFLELRREVLHANIELRCAVIRAVREIMHAMGFYEFQTPILTSSSPEGARDFIVPSRLHPGKFFALPQAPQQFKQLAMISGFDRYFQIAPCFRDEDARADRSAGEFYQIDMELSFVEQDDVFAVNERLMYELFSQFSKFEITKPPFPQLRYDDVLEQFGSDKPDLRNPLRIRRVSDLFTESGFKVFSNAIAEGGGVWAIAVPLEKIPPRKYFDDGVVWFQGTSGSGLAYLSFDYTDGAGECRGSIRKFFSDQEIAALQATFEIQGTTSIFFGAGDAKTVLPALGKLREKLAADFELLEKDVFRFCWITDYRQFEFDEEHQKIEFGHNPFSMPQGGLEALNSQDPLEIHAHQYDLVCNGHELASGAIRNHKPEVMYRAFEICGYSKEEVDEKFGGMIRAFRYGAPPHGGIAHGVDRIVMLLAGESAIREVIMFPLTQNAEDLLMGAPSPVSAQQLKDVHIAVSLPKSERLKES